MNFAEFKKSIEEDTPPQHISAELKALWYDGKGDWETSHDIAQEIHNTAGSWIHAYLHRKEGDISNARYWYRLANRPEAKMSLTDEWEALVQHFLGE